MADKPDYFIVSFQTDKRPNPWRWEIRRHSRPMGIIIGADGFQSQSAAEYAGRQALDRFLTDLAKDERR